MVIGLPSENWGDDGLAANTLFGHWFFTWSVSPQFDNGAYHSVDYGSCVASYQQYSVSGIRFNVIFSDQS